VVCAFGERAAFMPATGLWLRKNDDIILCYRISRSERIPVSLSFTGKDKMLSTGEQGALEILFTARRAAVLLISNYNSLPVRHRFLR